MKYPLYVYRCRQDKNQNEDTLLEKIKKRFLTKKLFDV